MKKIIFLLFSITLLASCNKGKVVENTKRTVIVYIEADNDLYPNAVDDLNEMEQGWNESYDGAVMVYLNPRSATVPARLYKVKKGTTSQIESEIVKEYAINEDATVPSVLSRVIADAREAAPSDNYGLVLWSHSTGWIPNSPRPLQSPGSSNNDANYTFGANVTYRTEMEIYDLELALPRDIVFDYISSDACHMASIEIAYQLKDRTKYLIASAAETFDTGMPYDQVIGDLMSANVVNIASKTFEYYNAESGAYRSSTMSVIDCSKLTALAASVKDIVTSQAQPQLASDIQQFGRGALKNIYFDLSDFVNKTWAGSPKLAAFNNALNAAVLYKNTTPILFEGWRDWITVNAHCGMTAYIPKLSQPKTFAIFRDKYTWATDSGFSTISF